MAIKIVHTGEMEHGSAGEVRGIAMTPTEYAFKKAGETGQLRIKAKFADDSEEDITAFCDYRTNDDAVATVNPLGQVKAVKPGDTAVIVSYRGQVLPVRVMVPTDSAPGWVTRAKSRSSSE